MKKVIKRDGIVVPFNGEKIKIALLKAFNETQEKCDVNSLYEIIYNDINNIEETYTNIEKIQDMVEKALMSSGYHKTAKAYILYREERTHIRDKKVRLMNSIHNIITQDSKENDTKRENANIDANTAMGTMLKIGAETSKEYCNLFMINPEHSKNHLDGYIHIHDQDFLPTGTTTCTQIDLQSLFENGFNTGHGTLRKPNSIHAYSELACIAIQANQNEQHGGQSIPNFDRFMADGVKATYRKKVIDEIANVLYLYHNGDVILTSDISHIIAKQIVTTIEKETSLSINNDDKFYKELPYSLTDYIPHSALSDFDIVNKIREEAIYKTDRETYQAMEACIHNLNTLHSRAGAQVPFSSLNYGTDISPEGRMVIKNVLLATEAGLGNGETPIFPIQIFRCKHGVNFDPGDPNYDLYELSLRVSAKRLFPNYSFQDASYNLKYYKEGHPETEIAYMGCRTRVMANVCGPEISYSRGNLSFTTINLPRIGIESNGNWDKYYSILDEKLELVKDQLLERLEIQKHKKMKNFPFLLGQGLWLDGKKLKPDDEIGDILNNGTLSIGFIGLAESLIAMMSVHHGESEEAQAKGLEIVNYIRDYCDRMCDKYHLNFTCLATPAEGLSGRFIKLDKAKYGTIEGVTDREYYTNSFHVPVYYNTTAFSKISIEAPYHALTNAGHISYIEMDGDPSVNLKAFDSIVHYMEKCGMGYGAINHPVDRDTVCGYNGIIYNECPNCGRKENSDGIPFERIRRITGYLVGTLDRFNNAKAAEERDRIKHI